MKKNMAKKMVKMAEKVALASAQNASYWHYYQPKEPKELIDLSRNKMQNS